jgi:hypothetical protein
MKIAVILNGQPRFTSHFYDFLQNKLPSTPGVDWFIWTWNHSTADHPHIPQNWTTNILDNQIYKAISSSSHKIVSFNINTPCNDYYDEFDRLPKQIETNQKSVWYMFKSLYHVGQDLNHYENLAGCYDLIIKIRADLTVDLQLDYQKYYDIILSNPNLIITGSHSIYTYGYNVRPINDWFAIGSSNSMRCYTNLWPNVIHYAKHCLPIHPESFLSYHLSSNNISWIHDEDIRPRIIGRN